MAKIAALILARGQNTRLRDKHLIIVNGKPLIQYTFEYAKASPPVTDIICSSDSKKILELSRSFGIKAIERPAEFARGDSPIIDAIEHTLLCYKDANGLLPEITVILYGNVPIRGTSIAQGLELLHRKNADAAFTACRVGKYHPEWMFRTDGEHRIIFDTPSLNIRCQDLPVHYTATDSFIIARTSRLLNRRPCCSLYSDFGDDIFFVEEERGATIDVDDMVDLNYFRFLVSGRHQNRKVEYWKEKEG